MDKHIEISIVIELENCSLHYSEFNENLIQQLLSIKKQLVKTQYEFEILICFSTTTINSVLLENTRKFAEKNFFPSQLKFLSFDHASYYQLKNYGADSSQGNIIIFLDSDVTTDLNWVANLLKPFEENKDIKVVAGRTELKAQNTIQYSQLLVTFFDNYKNVNNFDVTKNFFANNVAFKKELFLKYKFPINQQTARTSCCQLAQNLSLDNIKIHKQHQAIVYHRSASSLSELLLRSVIEGRDQTMLKVEKYKPLFKRASIPIKIFKSKCKLLTHRISYINTHRHAASISITSLIIAFAYILIMSISAALTLLLPRFMSSRLHEI